MVLTSGVATGGGGARGGGNFDYQLRRHVRKRNRAMFEKNIFHFSDFFSR